jgi:hypothetical protein
MAGDPGAPVCESPLLRLRDETPSASATLKEVTVVTMKRSFILRIGALALTVGAMMVLPACSDTPEGFQTKRGGVSVPRNDPAKGGGGAAVDIKAAEPEKKN